MNRASPEKTVCSERCGSQAKSTRGKRSADHPVQGGTESPQDEDAHEHPACPPMHNTHRAGDFENPIAQEEQAGAETEDSLVKSDSSFAWRPFPGRSEPPRR